MYPFFFLLLFPALFLGDGLQPLVDIYLAATLLFGSLFLHFYRKPFRTFPRNLALIWGLIILYYLISVFFSLSPGLSVSAFIRLLFSYLIYYIFYTHSSSNSISGYQKSLLIFVSLASVFSLLLTLFPNIAQTLPSTNLLYANFGHNHLGVLLIFVLPYVTSLIKDKKSIFRIALFIFYIYLIFLTRGRGIIIFSGLFLIFELLQTKLSLLNRIIFLFTTLLLFSFLLGRPFQKTYSPFNSRVKYFTQAWDGFISRPIFGNGPGTFYLLSQKHAVSLNSTSFYVHSFPLQILTETGLIGFGLWFILFYTTFRSVQFKKTRLLSASLLLLIYSFIDFSLDFIVIWLIFWSALALLIHKPDKAVSSARSDFLIYRFPLTLLILFYILYFTSSFFSNSSNWNLNRYAFYLTPFDRYTALKMLQTVPVNYQLSFINRRLISFFHKQDSEIQFLLYKYQSPELSYNQNILALKEISMLSPFKWEIHNEILKIASNNHDISEVSREINYISRLLYPDQAELINKINFSQPEIQKLYKSEILAHTQIEKSYNSLFRFYYELGRNLIDTNPQLTRLLWRLAARSYPTWGMLYAEQASLEYFVFKDTVTSHQIISECLNTPQARQHCLLLDPGFSNLQLPGDLRSFILTGY